MAENTAENILIENDTFALKREYKRALENLSNIKQETAETLSILEKAKREYEEKQEDLRKVVNDISQEKLDWATHRNGELVQIEEKMSEANNVIKRKKELNEQEEVIRQLEQKNTDILNEIRRIKLEVKEKRLEIENQHKDLEKEKNKLKEEIAKFDDSKTNFNTSLVNLVKQWMK